MKIERIKSVSFNNRRKIIRVQYSSVKIVEVHYGQLGIDGNLSQVWVDRETRGMSIGMRLIDGREEFMPYDQPLAIARDPEYLLQNHIERMIAEIKEVMTKKRISKRYLADQLGTSDNQIQRLLNPQILNKNLEQLYKIAALLTLELEWRIKRAA